MVQPPDLTQEATAPGGATVTFDSASFASDDNGSPNVSCSPDSGATFPLGTTAVSCTATDTVTNETTPIAFSVTVTDTTPPTLAVTPPTSTIEATGPGGAEVTFSATATDVVDASPRIDCAPASGSTFALGTTHVRCTATDGAGNTSAATEFDVTVTDTTPPTLTVTPPGGPVEATGPDGAAATFSASATDAVDGTDPVVCDHVSGSTFPFGTTTVTCSVTDAHHNAAAPVHFDVVVRDTTPPAITFTAPASPVAATGPAGAVVTYTASARDIVDGPVAVSCGPSSGSTFPIGTTPVHCTATDARSNTATVDADIRVADLAAPVLAVPAPITLEATGATGAVATFAVGATDNVDGHVAATCTPSSGSTFPVGLTTVNCDAADAAGNHGSASFTVNVRDTQPPTLDVPPTTVVVTSGSSAAVTYSAAATDVVDGAVTPVCTPASGASFPLGDTTVQCTARDANGNVATKSFVVRVNAQPAAADTTPPLITVPSDIAVAASSGAGATVTFSVTAVDGVDGSVPVSCAPASGSMFPVGATVVRCSARDASGNTAAKTFNVTVRDRTPPPPVVLLPPTAVAGRTILVWRNPAAPDLDHIEVLRARVGGGSPILLYRGSASTFTDTHTSSGVAYRYTVFAVDTSGNRTGVAMVVRPVAALLVRPLPGARVSSPPTLLWVPAAKATYYNVQLFRNGAKVLSVWTAKNSVALGRTWSFGGHVQHLAAGSYRWFVFPGYGKRAARTFGHVLGTNTFVVTG